MGASHDTWTCERCGTANALGYDVCDGCGVVDDVSAAPNPTRPTTAAAQVARGVDAYDAWSGSGPAKAEWYEVAIHGCVTMFFYGVPVALLIGGLWWYWDSQSAEREDTLHGQIADGAHDVCAPLVERQQDQIERLEARLDRLSARVGEHDFDLDEVEHGVRDVQYEVEDFERVERRLRDVEYLVD